MIEYILIIVLLVDIGFNIYTTKKVDKFKDQIKNDDIPELYRDLASTKDRLRVIENKDVNTNLKSNYYTTIGNMDSVQDKLTKDEFNKLYNFLEETNNPNTVNSGININDDNSICIVKALDPLDSTLDNIRIIDIRDFNNISILYTIEDMGIPVA